MTQQTAPGAIPELTLGWRLRMSLDHAGISVQTMAEQLGVTRATLSRWMSDKGKRPNRAYISQWALGTGVPFEWLNTGEVTPHDATRGKPRPVFPPNRLHATNYELAA
jgi:transcriptional regulator with XRE-family HTH domain